MIYFTADTHYSHKNICRGTSEWDDFEEGSSHQRTRDFKTLEEMDEFAQTHDLEEEMKQGEEIKLLERESENFNEDYQRFLRIINESHVER